MGIKLSDAEILSNIMASVGVNANQLKEKTGYKSAATFYHILNGTSRITKDMAERICEVYPNVNLTYLLSGHGEAINSTEEDNLNNLPRASFDDVPQTLKNIEQLLKQILNKLNN